MSNHFSLGAHFTFGVPLDGLQGNQVEKATRIVLGTH